MMAAAGIAAAAAGADPASSPPDPAPPTAEGAQKVASDEKSTAEELWNWHTQTTVIGQYHPGFHALYSGPNSMTNISELKETLSLDLFAGVRLWPGAEFHVDGLLWQGFGFSHTLGAEGFPNGEAFRLGKEKPNVNFARVFLRQTIGLGGDTEPVPGDALHLGGTQDVSRVTVTVGRMSVKDIFDNNAYANDPRTQFMNWSFFANEAWDFPADSIGYTTGLAAELNEPGWTVRYGFFQVSRNSNGTAQDSAYLRAWAMVAEFERRYTIGTHPGAVRLLGFLNRARMGSYEEVVDNPAFGGDITLTRTYRYKYGFGLNLQQELAKGLGAFIRLGWGNGKTEAWMFSDVDHTLNGGLSLNGQYWGRPDDTLGWGVAVNGISKVHQEFFNVGGTGILAGDGRLTYGLETLTELYYDFGIWKTLHVTLGGQFINHPAFNRDRGPIWVAAGRLHWEF